MQNDLECRNNEHKKTSAVVGMILFIYAQENIELPARKKDEIESV